MVREMAHMHISSYCSVTLTYPVTFLFLVTSPSLTHGIPDSLVMQYITLHPTDDLDSVIVSKRDPESAHPVRVASMDYFVPEKVPQPKNVLESLVWDREKEVDRARERFQVTFISFCFLLFTFDRLF
jgi:hypothetical protein